MTDFGKMVMREGARDRLRRPPPVEDSFDPFDRSTFTGTDDEYTGLLWEWMRADPPSPGSPPPSP